MGQQFAQSLVGRCGSLDVFDCHATATYMLSDPKRRLDAAQLFVDGGSHGGFLALHLLGQYPSAYRAAVCRNPVTAAQVMEGTNDIPDWYVPFSCLSSPSRSLS